MTMESPGEFERLSSAWSDWYSRWISNEVNRGDPVDYRNARRSLSEEARQLIEGASDDNLKLLFAKVYKETIKVQRKSNATATEDPALTAAASRANEEWRYFIDFVSPRIEQAEAEDIARRVDQELEEEEYIPGAGGVGGPETMPPDTGAESSTERKEQEVHWSGEDKEKLAILLRLAEHIYRRLFEIQPLEGEDFIYTEEGRRRMLSEEMEGRVRFEYTNLGLPPERREEVIKEIKETGGLLSIFP